MKRIIILSVFLVLLSLTQGQDKVDFPPQPKPPSSTAKPTEAPTHPPKTTTPPTTTPSVPTTTPTVPTTTPTVPPTTTSEPPTTTSAPTTPAPTTPAPRPSTTVAPTPKPDAVGTWSLNYTNTNLTCIVLEMQLHLKVPYTSTQEKTLNASIPVSNIATATGKCVDEDMQNITLVWNEKNSIKFMFERNETSKQFMLATISVAIVPDSASFPNMTDNATINAELNKHEFVTPLKMSYRCSKEETLNVPFISNENKSMTFVISKLQMEAFRNTTGMVFSTAEDCEPFETPGIVPIAVGCSLAALIILVLIAYLVGRRRSQARGYLSMFSEKQREAEYIPMKNFNCFGKQ